MKKLLLSFLLVTLSWATMAQTIRYVKPVATGTGAGTSWTNASDDLQATLNNSAAGDQIWVAGGTYKPNRKADALNTGTPYDNNNAFILKADVKVYGGFAGTETLFAQRNLTITANKSILSGDLDNDNSISGGDAYHVVISSAEVGT
eukprot:gene17802-21277_t